MFFCVIFSDRCLCSATVCSPTNLLLNYFWIFLMLSKTVVCTYFACLWVNYISQIYYSELILKLINVMDICITSTSKLFIKCKYKITELLYIIIFFFLQKQTALHMSVCVHVCVIIRWKYGLILLCFLQPLANNHLIKDCTKQQNQINRGSTHLFGIIGSKGLRALLKTLYSSFLLSFL